MIKSMTAFANSETNIENLVIVCEFRSVNHRYCDITVKLPEKLRFSEPMLRALISSQLKRGKIECSLYYKKQMNNGQNFIINEDAVIALLKATTQIEEHLHTLQPFSALEVLTFPGIQQEAEANKELLLLGLTDLVKKSLEKMLLARTREGSELALLISERCRKIDKLVDSAFQIMPEILEKIRSKIMNRLTLLVSEPDFDRLEQEMVFLAQKLDVAEELDRLKTHVKEVTNVLQQNEPVGRRLDFLMQEMNREANTLGSKSADKEMTQISIDLKVLIEQMREQIQNIE